MIAVVAASCALGAVAITRIGVAGAVGFTVAAVLLGRAAVVDARTQRIPGRLLLSAATLAVAAALVGPGAAALVAVGAGLAGALAPLVVVRLARPIGMGDVKMAAAVGAVGGLLHPLVGLGAVFLMSIAAPAFALARRTRSLALGPWLWCGLLLSSLVPLGWGR